MELARAQKGFLKVAKRCPDCFSNIPLEATECPWCKRRLKASADKHGYAKKPINWYAYLMCFLSWLGVVIYIWWAFFR